MANDKMILIEIAYAAPDKQRILAIEVPENSTIETAIDRSGILEIFPEIDLNRQKVGIYSKRKNLNDVVKEGDRVEIYRELLVDPKERRRKKAVSPKNP